MRTRADDGGRVLRVRDAEDDDSPHERTTEATIAK
jgi:hypothetical protein